MSSGSDDPERLIRQALRAQVGGPKQPAPGGTAGSSAPRGSGGTAGDTGVDSGPVVVGRLSRLTVAQVLLLAAIFGLVIGMAAGFAVLALR